MLKITLDTNCIINILDSNTGSATSVEQIAEIIKYGLDGDVNIAITTRVENDLKKDKDSERKNDLLKRIYMFPVIGTVIRFDVSKFNSGDVLVGDGHVKLEDELKRIIFPNLSKEDNHYSNKINDIDHLVGHIINKRDIFITDDSDILKKAETLKSSLGLLVMNPSQTVEYININAKKEVLVKEFYDKLIKYKELLVKCQKNQSSINQYQNEYSELREWFIKKYPIIKDGFQQFQFKMHSVPVGNLTTFSQMDLMNIQYGNKTFQSLYSKPNLIDQFESFFLIEHDYAPPNRLPQNEDSIDYRFQPFLDLFLSYVGYLEK